MRPLREWAPQTRFDKAALAMNVIGVLVALTGFVLSFTPLLNKQIDSTLFSVQMFMGICIFPLGYYRLRFWKDWEDEDTD